jgi:hypothetical protein
LRSPFFAYFLWRSKESERLPGRPRQRTSPRRKNSITNNKPKTKQTIKKAQENPGFFNSKLKQA